jgi:hypothetical protein
MVFNRFRLFQGLIDQEDFNTATGPSLKTMGPNPHQTSLKRLF